MFYNKDFNAAENAQLKQRAKEAAERYLPNEIFEFEEEGIFISKQRTRSKKSSFQKELEDARILVKAGSTVYLTSEYGDIEGFRYDAIVDGERVEFKNLEGNSNSVQKRFLESRSQAPNVFLNFDKTSLSKNEIYTALYMARNKRGTDKSHGYDYYNKFSNEGKIIMYKKEWSGYIVLNVDYFKK